MSSYISKCLCILPLLTAGCELLDGRVTPVCQSSVPSLQVQLLAATPSSTCPTPNGSIVVKVKNGQAPFRYSIDQGEFQQEGTFSHVSPGDHLIQVTDGIGCRGYLSVFVKPAGDVLRATAEISPDDRCFSDAGTIRIEARGGTPPYQYKIDSLSFQSDSIFYRLDKGSYWVRVRDIAGCEFQLQSKVEHGFTGVSYLQHGSIIVRYAGNGHLAKNVPENEIQYIRCWIEDGTLNN
ncbi:MAG: hypothetical protein ACOYW3_00875 [Bacteroidota bacterium]